MFLIANDYWQVKKTKEKGLGVFANKEIEKGTIIGDYLGTILHPRDVIVDEENFYLMYYHDRAVIAPDLEKPGIHLLNHSCAPNCFMYVHEGHTLFFALRKIETGEELTISYLLSPNENCDPCEHVCKCASKLCTGTMHLPQSKFERWQEFQNRENKKTKKKRVFIGKKLPKLASYPPTIPHDSIYSIMCSVQA